MEKYINYLLESIIFDAQGYDHWWMWTIIPAFFYTLFLVLKYTVLTLPVWLPFNLILGALRKKKNEINKRN